MTDYMINDLAFGHDYISGMKVGYANIPIRQYYYQNDSREDRVIGVEGMIEFISTEDKGTIIFTPKGSDKSAILYANGYEGCFKDWSCDLDFTQSLSDFAECIEEDLINDPEFIRKAKRLFKKRKLAPIWKGL